MTFRMRREAGQLRCSDSDQPLLDDDLGWNQISRRARARGLAPPTVDTRTQEYVYAPAPSQEEAERLWKFNAKTQWDALARAHAGLVRLGELDPSEPLVMPFTPPVVPAPRRALPTQPPPAPPAATPSSAAAVVASSAPSPEPQPQPEIGPDEFPIAALAAQARKRGEKYRLAVCVLALDGRDALVELMRELELPAKTRGQLHALTQEEAHHLAMKWVAEARSQASP